MENEFYYYAVPLFIIASNFLFLILESKTLAFAVNFLVILLLLDHFKLNLSLNSSNQPYLIPFWTLFLSSLLTSMFPAVLLRNPKPKSPKQSPQEIQQAVLETLSKEPEAYSFSNEEVQKRLQERQKWRNAI